MTEQQQSTAKKVRVTLLKRPIDRKQATVVRGMGLRRLNHTVELQDSSSTRGMIHKVRHLVRVEN